MARKKKDEVDHIGRNSSPTADVLRGFVERVERLNKDAAAIADDIKEVYSEAKAFGLDTKVMRAVVAERKKNKDDVAEFEAIREIYREVLGMGAYAGTDDGGDGEGDGEGDADTDGVV